MGLVADIAALCKTFVKKQWKRAKFWWIRMNLQKTGCQDMTQFRLWSVKVKLYLYSPLRHGRAVLIVNVSIR